MRGDGRILKYPGSRFWYILLSARRERGFLRIVRASRRVGIASRHTVSGSGDAQEIEDGRLHVGEGVGEGANGTPVAQEAMSPHGFERPKDLVGGGCATCAFLGVEGDRGPVRGGHGAA